MGLVFPEYLSKWTTDRVKEGKFIKFIEHNDATATMYVQYWELEKVSLFKQ